MKLIDFGASTYKDKVLTRQVFIWYQRIWQRQNYIQVKMPDERTDIYGIGALIYFMVMGHKYDHKKKWKTDKKFKLYQKSFIHIIAQCMNYYPVFRYPSVAVLKNKLLELNRKKQYDSIISKYPLNIAIAGTQNRIGTTHLAIMITTYLNYLGKNPLYIENNNTGGNECSS